MAWFRRRKAGRHQLGAAVREIPSAAPAVVWVPSAPVEVPAPAVPVPRETPAAVAPGPRVELGFRDGTTAALAPDSAQAKALTEIAQVLTRKD